MKSKELFNCRSGVLLTKLVAIISRLISKFIPYNLINPTIFALIISMIISPLVSKYSFFKNGIKFVSKKVLTLSITLLGGSLSIFQVLEVGKNSLFVMIFTLITAFLGGYILGKLFNMNWKLTSLISIGVGVCGGSAIAALAPTIDTDSNDLAYSISTIFIIDIIMVIVFPLLGQALKMTDMSYGLWTGTAIHDAS